MGECTNSVVRAPSGCLLEDRACWDGVAVEMEVPVGVPAGDEPAGCVGRPGVPSQTFQEWLPPATSLRVASVRPAYLAGPTRSGKGLF